MALANRSVHTTRHSNCESICGSWLVCIFKQQRQRYTSHQCMHDLSPQTYHHIYTNDTRINVNSRTVNCQQKKKRKNPKIFPTIQNNGNANITTIICLRRDFNAFFFIAQESKGTNASFLHIRQTVKVFTNILQ